MKAPFSAIASSMLTMLAANGYADTEASSSEAPKSSPMMQQCCPATKKGCGMRYELFGDYLFLQPNGSDIYYAAEAVGLNPAVATPILSPYWKIKDINPDYHSGFDVGVNFLFDNANVNLALDWERLHTQDSAHAKTTATGVMFGPMFDIGPNSMAYSSAKGKATFEFDAVNLDFGGQFCFFERLHANIYMGAAFARIKQALQSNFSNASGSIARDIKTHSTFTGGGPQFGLDYDYRMCSNFFLTGSSVASLFMGQLKNGTTFASYSPLLPGFGLSIPNKQSTSEPNRAQLVPAFEQKIGFSYLASFNCVKLNFGIGYQCQIYINAVQTTDMTYQVVPDIAGVPVAELGVFAGGFERTLSNFILTGPYASLDIIF